MTCGTSAKNLLRLKMVIRVLQKNTQIAQESIQRMVEMLPEENGCDVCPHILNNAIMTQPDKISPQVRKKLDILINKYI